MNACVQVFDITSVSISKKGQLRETRTRSHRRSTYTRATGTKATIRAFLRRSISPF